MADAGATISATVTMAGAAVSTAPSIAGATASSTAAIAGEAIAATLSAMGRIAGDPLAEADLAIDATGDLLTIDGAGDELIVTPAIAWTGQAATEAV